MRTSDAVAVVLASYRIRHDNKPAGSNAEKSIIDYVPISGPLKAMLKASPGAAVTASVGLVGLASVATAWVDDNLITPIAGIDRERFGLAKTIASMFGYKPADYGDAIGVVPEASAEEPPTTEEDSVTNTPALPSIPKLSKSGQQIAISDVPKIAALGTVPTTSSAPAQKPAPVPVPAPNRARVAEAPAPARPAGSPAPEVPSRGKAHAGTKSITFLSKDERAHFDRLVAAGETFTGGKGLNSTIRRVVTDAATRNKVPVEWALAMVSFESGGSPNAVSTTGAIGLYQFTYRTAKAMGLTNRFDIYQNADGGARLIAENLEIIRKTNKGLKARGKVPIEKGLTEVYLMHQLGPPAFLNVHNSMHNGDTLTADTKKAMGLNLGVSTAEKYYEMNRKKILAAAASSATDVNIAYRSGASMDTRVSVASASVSAEPAKPPAPPSSEPGPVAVAAKPMPTKGTNQGSPTIFQLPNGALAYMLG